MDASLRQIRSFVAVAHFGSFTRAASALNMAQPTLTVQIRRLEEALGLKLFDRNTRAVELTRAGRDVLPTLEKILRDLDLALVDVRDAAEQQRGTVRIAALPSVAASVLPAAIHRFRIDRPRVSFVLHDAVASRGLALVRSDEVDLGVVGGPLASTDIDILAEWRDALCVVFPAGHPLETAAQITAEVVAAHPLILMDPSTSVRAVTDAAFERAALFPIPACEATYMMTAVGMVRAGLGVTLLPASAREPAAEPTLRSRPIDDPAFSRPVRLIKKAGRTLPPLAASFASLLQI